MSMEKKMYYSVDNSDTKQIVDSLKACLEIIDGEWVDATIGFDESSAEDELPYWTISPIWMTEEDFKNLPDAY